MDRHRVAARLRDAVQALRQQRRRRVEEEDVVPGTRAVEPHALSSDAVPPTVPLAPSVPPAAVGSAPYGWPAGPPKVRKGREGGSVLFLFLVWPLLRLLVFSCYPRSLFHKLHRSVVCPLVQEGVGEGEGWKGLCTVINVPYMPFEVDPVSDRAHCCIASSRPHPCPARGHDPRTVLLPCSVSSCTLGAQRREGRRQLPPPLPPAPT